MEGPPGQYAEFYAYLNLFCPIAEKDWEIIQSYLEPRQLRKGDFFIKKGRTSQMIGWITKGVCHYSRSATNRKEVTTYFVRETQFAAAGESFRNRSPSEINIQALTDVELLAMNYASFQKLYDQVGIWGKLGQKLIEYTLLQKVNYIRPMVMQDAMTRYELFMKDFPDVLQRVPLGYVASYLGMTQQSLSRLRKQLH